MINISKEKLKKEIADCAEQSFHDGVNHAIKAITKGFKVLREEHGVECVTIDEAIQLINHRED